jgi:hypothetical protein
MVDESPTNMIPGSLAAHLRDIGLGKKTLPLFERSRRHHFIPQFILRRFADPATRLLHQLDVETGTITSPGPKGAGWEPELYRVTDDQGRQNDYLEGFFSLVETHAADSIRALHDDPLALSEGDRANISLFLALQEGRTPGGSNRILHAANALGRLQLELLLKSPQAFGKSYRGKSAADVEQLRKDALAKLRDGRLEVSTTKELTLRTMLDTWLERAAPIHAMSWLVFRAQGGEFVIGDRVVTMFDPTPRFPWSGNGWLSSECAFATVPLSPDLCLRLDQPGGTWIAERNCATQIERINMRSYGWADRYVYARSRQVLENLYSLARADPERVERGRTSPHVILEEADPGDPTVGAKHPLGYPRGLWITDDDGTQRWCSYELLDTDAPPDDAQGAPGRPRVGSRRPPPAR